MTYRLFVCLTWLFMAGLATAQNANPRFIDTDQYQGEITTLKQNWKDAESNWFHNVPQGSRLVPYQWIVNLEQADSQEPFLSGKHVRELGYIPRIASANNPDALPIGFVKDAPYENGMAGMGITCAACHTAVIQHGNKTYLVDGAPAMGDFETLLRRMVAALKQSKDNPEKFKRFQAKVLGPGSSPEAQQELRTLMDFIIHEREGYNARNLSQNEDQRFGHGRVDAFGAIFNEVSSTFLGIPENARPADAPVSYPCLWDAPQHKFVQWNGAAENNVNDFGEFLFGEKKVGALGRNTGEVLGVFGFADIPRGLEPLPKRYDSTAVKDNLREIEETLTILWSPEFPGDIDAVRRDRGKLIYEQHCVTCHNHIVRTDPNRTVPYTRSNAGTDNQLLKNFVREGKTGPLRFRLKSITKLEIFGEKDQVAVILKHVVERAMLKQLSKEEIEGLMEQIKNLLLQNPQMLANLSPDFQNHAIAIINDQEQPVDFAELLQAVSDAPPGEMTDLKKAMAQVAEKGASSGQLGGKNLSVLKQAAGEAAGPEGSLATAAAPQNAVISLTYKSRPLNGIWATAPYLHNGSVRTLAELLKQPEDRAEQFHVGSIELDTQGVGFIDDPSYPVFNATITGNKNHGHTWGCDLLEEQKLDLIEYLKSL
ncbi:di-heme-cytochrome C peroxidase [Bremerella sp.]|uniref:di-heme-cytochrome C peroxidase n=1 Tax=Bremerella sp. TaxID=2795602 RepID=UPI00391D4642